VKILQAFDFLSLPHGGGTVDIVYKLSKALAKRGHDVTICIGDYEIDYHYLSDLDGVGIKVYHSYFNKHGFYLMPGLLDLDVRSYDVIHLHCYRSFQNEVISQKARKYKVPYIIDAHGSTVDLPGRKQLVRVAYDIIFGMDILAGARYLVAETETGAKEYTRLGVGKGKIRLQHPLLDASEFAMLPEKGTFRKKYHLGSEFMILFLGRLHQAKGIETLVGAVELLKDKGIDARLVLAGQDDRYKNTLINYMECLSTGQQIRLSFTGFLDGTDKLAALVDADVLVQPSRNEAGARPSLEAIMCGTPVIVSKDTGAGREIAKFDGGLLFDYGDAGKLATAIQYIMDRPNVSENRTVSAKEYIETNLSLDNGIVGYEKLYQEAVRQ